MTVTQLLPVLQGSDALPERPVLVTFDDGFRDFLTDALAVMPLVIVAVVVAHVAAAHVGPRPAAAEPAAAGPPVARAAPRG